MRFTILKIPADQATSVAAIRERGETVDADSYDKAVDYWIKSHPEDADPHRDFELAVLDQDGRHKMFTVFTKMTLDWRPSRYQGLA